MSFGPETSRPFGDDVDRHVADLEDVLVGLGRQAAHEVQLHLAPAVAVRGGDGADQVLFRDHLVDDLAHALGAALGGERQARAAAVAGQLVGQVDVEGVDAGRGQGEADLVLLVAVGQTLGDVADLAVVRGGEGQQADLLEAGRLQALLDHLADAGDGTLPHRAGDHARLAEAAAAGAAAEDLDRHPLVDGLGQRHQRLLGVRPLVQVHHGVLGRRATGRRTCSVRRGRSGRRAGTRRRRTPGRTPRRSSRGGTAPRRGRPAGPPPSRPRMISVMSSTACSPSPMTAQSMKSAIGSGLKAAWPPASTIGSSIAAVLGLQRDARQVQGGEHVGVAELGGEGQRRTRRRRRPGGGVHGELRDVVLPHQLLEVRPHAVRALGEDALTLVEYLVEDHDALVGQTRPRTRPGTSAPSGRRRRPSP